MIHKIFQSVPGQKCKKGYELILPNWPNLSQDLADVIELSLEVVHLGGHPLPVGAVPHIVFLLTLRP